MEKKELTIEEKKERNIFVIRVCLYVLFGLILPSAFIVWRYDLFKVVSKVNIGGWSLVLGLIILIFSIITLRYILHNKEYSYVKQIIKGVCYLILPLLFAIYVLYSVRETINQLIQVLGFITISETLAIIVNPLEEWAYKKSLGQQETFINYVFDKREQKKNNEKK